MYKPIFFNFILFCSCTIQTSVILLQGTSSSGKSSIAKELKNILPKENCILLSIDDFLWNVASEKFYKQNPAPLNKDQQQLEFEIAYFKESLFVNPDQDFWFLTEKNFHQEIKKYLQKGYLVIADTTLGIMDNKDILDFEQATKNYPVCKIIIYASPKILLKNLLKRNNYNIAREFRDSIDVISQFFELYRPTHHITSFKKISMQEIAEILQELKTSTELQANQEQERIKELEIRINSLYVNNFENYLETIMPYDFCIHNDGTYSPIEYAYQIF